MVANINIKNLNKQTNPCNVNKQSENVYKQVGSVDK